eukprot:scaffold110888_cov57-Phaeocystis_antarctica.AAC.2
MRGSVTVSRAIAWQRQPAHSHRHGHCSSQPAGAKALMFSVGAAPPPPPPPSAAPPSAAPHAAPKPSQLTLSVGSVASGDALSTWSGLGVGLGLGLGLGLG